MKIEKIEIKGLFGKKDICWELNPQVNVLVGENGSGKSTILSIMYTMLGLYVDNKEEIFNEAEMKLNNIDKSIYYIPIEKFVSEHDVSQPVSLIAMVEHIKKIKNLGDKIQLELDFPNSHKILLNSNFNENLCIEFIEANTSNIHANQNLDLRTRKENNPLDIEIQDTIDDLNKLNNSELINRLSGSLNFFFNQIDKQVTYENNEWIYTDTQLQKTLNCSDLSSGERQLIYILLRVALSNGDKSKTAIILMDEPEISLHLNWQAHFIKQLTILNPDAQFIIVTHSPALIMNGWNDVYVDMAEITRDMGQAQS